MVGFLGVRGIMQCSHSYESLQLCTSIQERSHYVSTLNNHGTMILFRTHPPTTQCQCSSCRAAQRHGMLQCCAQANHSDRTPRSILEKGFPFYSSSSGFLLSFCGLANCSFQMSLALLESRLGKTRSKTSAYQLAAWPSIPSLMF